MKISGKISEKGTGRGIPGVNIFIEGTSNGTFSDGFGGFLIENVNSGNIKLKISAIGYESIVKNFIISDQDLQLDIVLTESIQVLEGVVVNRVALVGGTANIKEIAGSAHYISPSELDKFSNTDINRVLRNIPGIIIQEEDGFGLRPNIGMRGTGVERSSKITLMEDGVLVAPAPYAAPAAYYFPSMGRMSGIEVRKGSSQIKYGPYTTGGAINFTSTPIPNDFKASVNLIAGSYGYHDIHAYAGASLKNVGVMAESLITNSDGFKDLDYGGNTGFIAEDYLAKIKINTDMNAKVYQSLLFKIGTSKETSNETYLGLTEADFNRTPYRRYAGSQKDKMTNKQNQWHLRHVIKPAKFMDITTTLYHSNFERNWYKLDKVKANDSTGNVSISKILNDPILYPDEMAIIKGATSQNDDALKIKANNRSYFLEGLESIIGLSFPGKLVNNDIEIGIRLHRDQMDRYQWVDEYRMADGVMLLTKPGIPGTDSNYILDAKALATFIQYKFQYGRLGITPGLRYEDIQYQKTDYGKEDPGRTGSNLSIKDHRIDIFIPGIGIDYAFTERTSSFIGIHKGFTPPGMKEGTDPEISVNYEAGLRYNSPNISIQSVLYYNDYKNLLGADLAASGGKGSGDQFNGGESIIYGIEYDMSFNLPVFKNTSFGVPLYLNYTYTHGTFQNNFESEYDAWSNVRKNDEIPYIPKHQFALNIGLQHKQFEINFSSKYVGDMRTVAGQDEIPATSVIDSYYVCDLSTNIQINRYLKLYGSVMNIFDNAYAVSRRPAGLRPGMPRNFRIGIKANIF